MKKSLRTALAIILAASLLGGCGGGGAASGGEPSPSGGGSPSDAPQGGDRPVITMWFWGAAPFQRDAMERHLIDAFNQSQEEYILEVEFRESVDDDVSVALSANQGPDIVYGSGPAFVSGFAGAGKLASLDTFAEQYGWKDRMLSPYYDACSVNGSLYSIPGALTTTGYCYNQKVLDDNGWTLPTTMDELVSIMDEAMEKGMYGSLTGAKGWRPTNELFANIMLTHMAGPQVMYQCLTGQKPWTSDEIKASLELCDDWYQKGYFAGNDYFNLDYSDAAQMFVDERSPFWFGPTLLFQFIQREAAPEQTGTIRFANFPNFNPDLPESVYDIGAVCSFSVNAACQYPDGAAMVLDRMLTPEFSVNMSMDWAGYWGMPIKNLKDADISGASGLSAAYLEACFDIIEAVDSGHFSYTAATFFPPSTFQRLIDIDTVWEGLITVDELVEEIDQAYQDDAAQNLVPPIPAPAL